MIEQYNYYININDHYSIHTWNEYNGGCDK